jgi:hypothetical protein
MKFLIKSNSKTKKKGDNRPKLKNCVNDQERKVSNLKVKTRFTEDKHFKMIAGGVTMDFFNLFIVFIIRKSRSGTEFQSFVQDEGHCQPIFVRPRTNLYALK